MYFFKKIICLIACVVLLAGCNFHLRGAQQFDAKLKTLYIQSKYPFDPFSKFLKAGFTDSHVILVDEPAHADLILNIVSQTEEQPMATVGSSQQVRQYTLYYLVTFQLEDNMGKIIYGPEQVTEQRSQIVQPSQVLSDSNETNQLYQIMYREAANDVLDIIASMNASKAIDKTLMAKKVKGKKIPRSSRAMTGSTNTSSSTIASSPTQNSTMSSTGLSTGSTPQKSTPAANIDPKNFSVNDLPAEQQTSPVIPQNAPTESELNDLK